MLPTTTHNQQVQHRHTGAQGTALHHAGQQRTHAGMADEEQGGREHEEEFSDGEIKATLGGSDGEDSSDITLTPTPPASPPGAPFVCET